MSMCSLHALAGIDVASCALQVPTWRFSIVVLLMFFTLVRCFVLSLLGNAKRIGRINKSHVLLCTVWSLRRGLLGGGGQWRMHSQHKVVPAQHLVSS